MRTRTLITVETGDQTSLTYFLEVANLLGLWWKMEENSQEAKVFRMLRANEFTLQEAKYAVAYVHRIADERMANAYEPTGINFVHGAEQERQFQDTIYTQGRWAKERADYFLECLREDLRGAKAEGVRPVSPRKSKKNVEHEDMAEA